MLGMTSRCIVVLALLVVVALAQEAQVHQECGERGRLPQMGDWVRKVGERASWHDAQDLPASISGEGVQGKWASFERPLPKMLDVAFLDQAEETFNHEQDFVPPAKCTGEHCNDFVLEGSPFVVALNNAYVDYDGLVFDSSWVYPSQGNRKWHEPHWQAKEEADMAAAAEQPTDPVTSDSDPLASSDEAKRHFGGEGGDEPMRHAGERPPGGLPGVFMPARPLSVLCVDKLVTILQPYQDNYYHFVAESLPRLIMARDIMLQDPSVRLLTRDQPFIRQFLAKLGITADRIETLHHDHVIFANTLYVPTPTKMFSPPQENLLALYQHLAVDVPVQGPRNLVIYTSREGSWSRDVANERFIIDAMRTLLAKTDLELVVFDGSVGVEETIGLFQRAILVIGPHGAGMTNMLWTQEGTKVIEFLHLSYPLLCYWHMAAAVGVEYWMLPIPESSWAGNMVVPVQEVLDIMVAALKPHFATEHPEELCPPGTALDRMRGCTPCPLGTFSYHPNSEVCTACARGQFAEGSGNTHCSMCPPGSYAAEEGSTSCTACPPAKGALEPNAPVVWGSRSQDTCPAHIRPDDPRFFHFYGVYAANNRAMVHPGHFHMVGACCMHWIVGVLLFSLLLLVILR